MKMLDERSSDTEESRDIYVADLFAGAGGLTEGFRQACFTPTIAVEYDRWAAETYAANFGNHILACPIEDVQVRSIGDGLSWSGIGLDRKSVTIDTPEIDILVGGPPCQGFFCGRSTASGEIVRQTA